MDARIAEVIDTLQGLVATYGAERLAIAGVAGFILVFLLVRRLARRSGGADSGGPERDYAALEQLDISESERLRRVLAERAGWHILPDRLLQELSMRLRSKDDVLGFISIVEAHRLLKGALGELDGADVEADVKAIAASIAGLAGKTPDDVAGLLRIVARIDPDNFLAVLALAGDHFGAGRYQQALQLLERGIPICREAVENPGVVATGSSAGAGDGMRQLLQKSMEMYEACLEQESSA